ncbi:MAG: MBL fold metallo-hydrolase [Myxococcota bacterium]|nr:MBL fold metallo-hydrolase [Myxococcota bacterium]
MAHAVSIVLIRHRPQLEVLWARRGASAPFLSGFNAFPGGFISDTDMGRVDGDMVQAQRFAILRELLEETGILLEPTGIQIPGSDADSPSVGEPLHARLLNASKMLGGHLRMIGDWPSPEYLGAPFTTTFFTAANHNEGSAYPTDRELEDHEWVAPSDALRRWHQGEVLLAPPTLWFLQQLTSMAWSEMSTPADPADHLSSGSPIRADIQLMPVKTPTLPPATHTNCYLVGERNLWIVEPASASASEIDRLCRRIDERCADGARVRGVILTHHHHDHIGGVEAMMTRYGVDCWAHPETASRVPFPVHQMLNEGDRLPHSDGRDWQVLFTPGHAPGHICLFSPNDRTMIVGDMVAGLGTILVEPVDGDMAAYLRSLERMKTYDPACLLPSHGPVIGGAVYTLDRYIAHRLMRERKIFESLSMTPQDLQTLVHHAYDDAPAFLRQGPGGGIAGLSLHAHLIKLAGEGRAHTTDGGWYRIA